MAEEVRGGLTAVTRGFSELPGWRQAGLIIGVALAVALVIGLALWSQKPTYGKLYGGLPDKDAGLVIEALQQMQIPYEIEQMSGDIQIATERVHEVRMALAAQGLPKGGGVGFELLEKEQGFGTSEFIQLARHQRAIEGELARTIETIESVQRARVHLAIPKRSVFIRDRQDPTASVMVQLLPGRALEQGQVRAIVHMVASSVPSMVATNVKVVDQEGRLLTAEEPSAEIEVTGKQYDYTRKIERDLVKRIEDILMPVVGAGAMRAQVSAELDFTVTEQTRESYNPDLAAVRSEQRVEERRGAGAGIGGVQSVIPGWRPAPSSDSPWPWWSTIAAASMRRATRCVPHSMMRRSNGSRHWCARRSVSTPSVATVST